VKRRWQNVEKII